MYSPIAENVYSQKPRVELNKWKKVIGKIFFRSVCCNNLKQWYLMITFDNDIKQLYLTITSNNDN
jgi:hypothetical protein